MDILIQFLGIMGFVLSIITFQQNEHRRMILMQFLANLCFAVHFWMLGAITGGILNFIGVLRCSVYFFKDKKWAASNWWLVFFSLVCVVVGIVTWQGPLSLLPTVAMILTTVAFGIKNPRIVRLLNLPSSPLWLIYNVINFSLGGILTECFNIISIFIGMLRFDKKECINNRM